LPVREEANDRGFLEHFRGENSEAMVSVSAAGARFLADRRLIISTGRDEQ
jgi:hypothetical protein